MLCMVSIGINNTGEPEGFANTRHGIKKANMGYEYGIKTCRETLLKLATNNSLEDRLGNAFAEIGVIEADDASAEHFQQIKRWEEEYLKVKELEVTADGSLQKTDKIDEEEKLAESLVWICVRIIEFNASTSDADE